MFPDCQKDGGHERQPGGRSQQWGVGGWAGDTQGIRAGLVDCGQVFPRDNVDSRHGNRKGVERWCRAPDRLGMTAGPLLWREFLEQYSVSQPLTELERREKNI